MRESNATYTIKDPNGQVHNLPGDPNLLTLQDALTEAGKQGGESWSPSQVRVKVGSQTYRETDFSKSFRDLGIQPGATIEVLR